MVFVRAKCQCHIRSQYGAGIQQEVINDVIRDTVFEALGNQKNPCCWRANIDDVKLEDDFFGVSSHG